MTAQNNCDSSAETQPFNVADHAQAEMSNNWEEKEQRGATPYATSPLRKETPTITNVEPTMAENTTPAMEKKDMESAEPVIAKENNGEPSREPGTPAMEKKDTEPDESETAKADNGEPSQEPGTPKREEKDTESERQVAPVKKKAGDNIQVKKKPAYTTTDVQKDMQLILNHLSATKSFMNVALQEQELHTDQEVHHHINDTRSALSHHLSTVQNELQQVAQKFKLPSPTVVNYIPPNLIENWDFRTRTPQHIASITTTALANQNNEVIPFLYDEFLKDSSYQTWLDEPENRLSAPILHELSQVTPFNIVEAKTLLEQNGYEVRKHGVVKPKEEDDAEFDGILGRKTKTENGDTKTTHPAFMGRNFSAVPSLTLSKKASAIFNTYGPGTNGENKVFFFIAKDPLAPALRWKSKALAVGEDHLTPPKALRVPGEDPADDSVAWICPSTHIIGFGAGFIAYNPPNLASCFACQTSRFESQHTAATRTKKEEDKNKASGDGPTAIKVERKRYGKNTDFSLPNNILVLQLAKEFYVDDFGTVRIAKDWKSRAGDFKKDQPVRTGMDLVKKEQFFGLPYYTAEEKDAGMNTPAKPVRRRKNTNTPKKKVQKETDSEHEEEEMDAQSNEKGRLSKRTASSPIASPAKRPATQATIIKPTKAKTTQTAKRGKGEDNPKRSGQTFLNDTRVPKPGTPAGDAAIKKILNAKKARTAARWAKKRAGEEVSSSDNTVHDYSEAEADRLKKEAAVKRKARKEAKKTAPAPAIPNTNPANITKDEQVTEPMEA